MSEWEHNKSNLYFHIWTQFIQWTDIIIIIINISLQMGNG